MLDIGGAASRRTIVLGTPCSSACTAGRRASYVHAQRENAKKTVEHFFRDGANTATAADACLRVHASDARAPFKTVHSPPLGGRGLGVGLRGGAFFLAKPQRTQRNKHGLAQTTKQSVLVCERPWQMITATDKHGLARTTFSASMDIFRGLDMLFHFV